MFNLFAQLDTLLGAKFLRIIEERVAIVVRQYDCSGIDGTCKAATSGFVTAGLD